MNIQLERKRILIKQNVKNDDDEQIEKALNFFDSILDQYLSDEDKMNVSSSRMKLTNNSSSSSLSPRDQTYLHPPPAYQSENFGHHYEQRPSAGPTYHVRRFTSENNLDHIPSSPKPKISHPRIVQTTATSTEDLSIIPLSKNFSSQVHLSTLTDKTNYLTSNGTSASLIDLTSIDKLSSRPHFRFVPPSDSTFTLEEEQPVIAPLIDSNFDQFHLKTISSNQTSFNNQNKYFHKIVKPTVIIPVTPKFVPVNRLTETNIYHQNDYSAFKPHLSSKKHVPLKVEPTPPSYVHIGITNSNNHLSTNTDFSHRQQSMMNLSSTGNTNMNGSRPLYQKINMKQPPYTPQSEKLNGHHHYHSPRSVMSDNPMSRIQQIANSSSISGLVHPSYSQPFINGERKTYPHGSHLSATSSIPPSTTGSDYFLRQKTYLNPANLPKYHSSQPPIPVQSVPFTSLPVSTTGIFPSSSSSNIYHFNQNDSPRDRQSKRNSNRQNVTTTTYL